MKLIDIGINLTHKSYQSDLDKVIKRAKQNHVSEMILTGTTLTNTKQSIETCKQYDGLYCTAGIHPHYVKDCNSDTESEIKPILQSECVVAVGECGLDFNRNFSPPQTQKAWFSKHIEWANQIEKPLFLHEREAFDSFHSILKQTKQDHIQAVVHCFTSSKKALEHYLDAGYFIGITGWVCDPKRGRELRELIQYIPLNKLMIETDGPFLCPKNLKQFPPNRRNEPAFLPHILQSIAKILGNQPNLLAEKIYHNTKQFFKLEDL